MDCIILDIDGTLWDTRALVANVWNQVIEEHGGIAFRATPDNLKNLFGKTMPEIAAIAFPDLSKEEQIKVIDQCGVMEREYLKDHPGKVFDGVPDTLKELSKSTKLCIVSNCQSGYIELMMHGTRITEYITDFECPSYSGLSKGENIRLIMERNGFKDAVYVGDTQGDADACKLAGVPFVYCEYGFGSVDHCDYSIRSFPELLTLF